MFTGIIEALGTVTDVTVDPGGESARITVDAGPIVHDLPRGGSLAVNGVCLTAVPVTAGDGDGDAPGGGSTADGEDTGVTRGSFTADVMGETLRRTSLGALAPGSPVNLERCMPAGGRYDGHVVQGHVDGLGTVSEREDLDGWVRLRVDIPADLARYTAEKGSIALNGTSLTLKAVSPVDAPTAWVEVGLIPATLDHTVFGQAAAGDPVNVEVDVLAKYAARLLAFSAQTDSTDPAARSHPGARSRPAAVPSTPSHQEPA
ncbi:riboflavin synthase [Brevibacterium litoralis]|uniref:riboflavin synthase n=1 Tax=Brevibacterium litoralis TaxID=3138935 RepID=UPI0032EB531C